MKNIVDASLIIPLKETFKEFDQLLVSFFSWSFLPKEIIIIESTTHQYEIKKNFLDFCDINNINLNHIAKPNLFPGHARNIGIQIAKSEILVFLDVLTIPDNDWFEKGYKLLSSNNFDGVWGKTIYAANSNKEQIIRASTYGAAPVKTFPGSFFKKNIFQKIGLFIESVRAGEDGDIFTRIEMHNLKMTNPSAYLQYVGLEKITYFDVIKKWHRNYLFSAKLPHFKAHKDLYFYALSGLFIILAFNWNQVFSYDDSIRGWNTDSALYLPNVTKISIISILLAYTFVRGMFMPLKKGVTFNFLIPINFIKIAIFCACLDLTKSFTFIKARLIQKN